MKDIYEYIQMPREERQKHIDLSSPCQIRGGNSTQFRGLLAYYLNTTIPNGHLCLCCHACNDGDCSNPLHLYWGTSKENHEDAVEAGVSHIIVGAKKGQKNNFFGLKPWLNNRAKPEGWLKAQYIYDNYVSKNWNFSKYGNGHTYFQRVYGLSQGTAKTMIRMFKHGWVPNRDSEWVEFKKSMEM